MTPVPCFQLLQNGRPSGAPSAIDPHTHHLADYHVRVLHPSLPKYLLSCRRFFASQCYKVSFLGFLTDVSIILADWTRESHTVRDESGFSRCTLANKRFSFVSKAFSSVPW